MNSVFRKEKSVENKLLRGKNGENQWKTYGQNVYCYHKLMQINYKAFLGVFS